MNVNVIIEALRKRCPSFQKRFAGAAEWADLTVEEAPPLPAAYVVPLREDAEENESEVSYYQPVNHVFGVIVLVSNVSDVRGQGAMSELEALKKELFFALLGWQQEPFDEFSAVVYEGGNLLYMDDARVAWQFEFSFQTFLTTTDTYQHRYLAGLPEFQEMDGDVDQIASTEPDGQRETSFKVDV